MSKKLSSLIILGASGDLTSRLLLPGLGQLLGEQNERHLQLIGVGGADWSDDDFRKVVDTAFSAVDCTGPSGEHTRTTATYLKADVTDPAVLQQLIDACEVAPAIYFALPPAVAVAACEALEKVKRPAGLTLALEKPFGTDVASAEALNAQLARLVPENQIHRVDHFLGRSTVFNLLGLRFANRMFEPIWNAEHIEKIDIVYDEQLGLEGRAGYYDTAGALIDMIQSHLLQVMAVVAMEPPSTLGADDLRDAKEIVLRATSLKGGDPSTSSRRARYTAGDVDGREMPAYSKEPGVVASRKTETLAEITVQVDTWRWMGVPFTLRSGKALAERRREIAITFKKANRVPTGLTGTEHPNVLRIFLAPDKMSLEVNVNGPGDPYELEKTQLEAMFGDGQLLAYREVLAGILDGDPSLGVRGDSAVEGWRIVAPVLEAWRADDVPLDSYKAGSKGPSGWAPIG